MKCGMILHAGGSNSPAAKKNRLRKAFAGRILWNSERFGQAVRMADGSLDAAPVNLMRRSKLMDKIRKRRDRRAMISMARKERRER